MNWLWGFVLDWVLPFLGIGIPAALAIVGIAAAIYLRLPLSVYLMIAGGLACYVGGWFLSDAIGDAKVLRLQAQIDQKKIDDQAATISALNEAARHSAQLAQLERNRADAAEAETAQIQKETDDAAAVAAANTAHRPAVCYLSPAELDGLRKRLH